MSPNKSKKSVKEMIKTAKKEDELSRRKKNNASSDSDDSVSSDSENESDEMDVHEYRKFLSKIFPSKNLNKKIKAGEKLKEIITNQHDEEESEWEEYEESEKEEEEEEIVNKKVNVKKSKSKPKSKTNTNNDKKKTTPQKPRKTIKKSKKVVSDSEDEISISSEGSESYYNEDDEDDEDENDEDEENHKKRGSSKFNIIFTIGGADNEAEDDEESEWLDEDDSEFLEEESEEETENEDESVSSDSDSESDSEYEPEEKMLTRKQKKELENKKQYKKKKSGSNVVSVTKNKDEQNQDQTVANVLTVPTPDDELLSQLRNLYEKNKNNETIQKCLEVCEGDIKKRKEKDDKKKKKQKDKNSRIFKKILKDKNTMNDFTFFQKLEISEQKKIIKELREINKITRIEKPYRITLLESSIPALFKSAAMKKINSLRYMEPGSGEFYKIKNWVDTFMRIPFGEHKTLPVTINDGVEKCHEFMENAQKRLHEAVYGLNDAKMQIMQMLGQLITNPQAIGCAVAIHGPPGTGKTSLVKEGISKILNRPFAFIALGGATDSSFLEGHSYTYEGSMWGKIVQILIDSKCMNPVIYFDELDKISDTPKGEEIAGILTHLTDTSQNSQFHDKYFAEIDFDLSKCLFIFSYNDETKVNPILKDRMYRIQTKGYNQKQKTVISTNYLLPKIREQVKFEEKDIIIPNETLHYIVDNLCNKEDGVRNLKRCLEIIYTKLNLYRLMKPGSNLFEEEMSLKVEFPFTVTREIVDKLIKNDKDQISTLYSMYV